MKKILVLLMVLALMMSVFVGCSYKDSAQRDQQEETSKIMDELNSQIGLPDVDNFYEKKITKEIYELRDDSSLVTYAYMQSLDGRFIYLGQCIGFGLPYSVQYSNPSKLVNRYGDNIGSGTYDAFVMPQAEPNGLFMPEGLSATWLMYINPDTGDREIIYAEPTITVTQSKLPTRLCAEWSLPSDY